MRSSHTFLKATTKLTAFSPKSTARMTGGLATLAASGEITGKALETVLLAFPRGRGREALAPRRGREAREIRGWRPAQNRRRRAALFEIARREEFRVSHARRRTRPRRSASHHRRLLVADFESDKYRSEKKNNKRDSIRLARRIRYRSRSPESTRRSSTAASSPNRRISRAI